MTDIIEAAQGRWPSILGALAGLTDQQLTDRHQPCPLCGGTDRYRFDDKGGSGSWFCNQCGGKDQHGGAGNGMDLLMRRNGWDFKTAAERVEHHLGMPSKKPPASTPRAGRIFAPATLPPKTAQTAPTPIKPPVDAAPPALNGATQQWCYTDLNGEQLFWIQRVPRANGDKWFRPCTWVAGTGWQNSGWPAPRPLYNLAALHACPTAQVIVCEGEKAADHAQLLFPSLVAVAWPNGAGSIDKVDWSPLNGRSILLWPDNDDAGRKAMLAIAKAIKDPAKLLTIDAPPGSPDKWDIADADWTPTEAVAYVKANHRPMELPEPEPEPEPEVEPEPEPEPIPPAKGGHFTCLGFDGDCYYYQPRSTGQVVKLTRSSHTSTNLCAVAPLAYWESLYPGKREGVNWTWAAASLFEQQAAVGVYSPDRIRGRGAWIDCGRTVLHLGDRLVVDGQHISVMSGLDDTAYLYQRLSKLIGSADATPLSDQEAHQICELAERFNWEVPVSGLLLAGWVTLAPVCGALRWRPHAWLTAAAGSGKSAILDRFVAPLLGDMGLVVAGNTSEAGLRQQLRADALPVVFDEAESNEKSDQLRMQHILSLARVASSESSAHMLKGSPGGDVMRFSIRSMFLMSSIATALKQGADRSRFAQLTLRSPNEKSKEDRIAHWERLDRDLDRYISQEAGRRLIARTTQLIPVIRQSIKVFTRVAAEHFDSQRLGDQYGTLLAGAWSLMSSRPATDDEARKLIRENDWDPYSQATEMPDEVRCIQQILQHSVRVEIDKATITRTLGELVDLAAGKDVSFAIGATLAADHLGRYGLRVEDDCLLVSNTAQAIAAILRDTAWSHSWGTLLARLPGAQKAGVVRFKGLGASSRAVKVPLAGL